MKANTVVRHIVTVLAIAGLVFVVAGCPAENETKTTKKEKAESTEKRNAQSGAPTSGYESTADSGSTSDAKNPVAVTLTDFAITMDSTTIDVDEITFSVKNDGPQVHELVVIKTDLPANQLPLTGDVVDESAEGIQTLGEAEEMPAGETKELTLKNLEPGKYVGICNIPGHYASGMRIAFEIK